MKTRILLMVMLALCVGITSCELPGVLTPDPVEDTVIGTTEFNLPQEGGEVEVKFTPNSSWTASCESDYVAFDPKSGEASTEEVVIAVTVAANEGEARTATLKVSFETNDVEITINQDENKTDDTTVEKTDYEVAPEGGDVVVEFVPTTAWTATSSADWLTLSAEKGEASESKVELKMTVAENKVKEARTAEVVLTFETNKVTLKVTQAPAGAKIVIFDTTEFSVPKEGGAIKIEFVPQTKWVALADEDFITVTPASGDVSTKKTTVILTVDPSTLKEDRTGTVTFQFEDNDVVVTVTQEGTGPIAAIEQTEYEVSFKAGSFFVKFVPKTAWTVKSSKTFITTAQASGQAGEEEVTVEMQVKENTSSRQRTAVLTFTFENNIVEVNVVQTGRPGDTKIATTEYSVSADGGEVKVKFNPTTAWTARTDAAFLTLDSTEGEAGTETEVTIKVAPNFTYEAKTGVVKFVFETNEVAVTINQSAKQQPSTPDTPGDPGITPDDPGTTPDNPDNPGTDPDDPGTTPDDPNNPSDPDDPDTPVDPDDPEDPEDPTTPDAGAGTEDVNKGDDVNINNNNYIE